MIPVAVLAALLGAGSVIAATPVTPVTRHVVPAQTYNGREHQLRVAPPRLEGDVTIDGQLDEPQWQQAARLTGFSQYAPSDGVPAADSTEIYVWYSAT
ncbi:MAG: hypothetical protein M3Z30_00845, partial [Gemmatimonadota bacterium]|nr:hypothetical protein [Gemmatimonadota bacterium]